MGRRRWSDRREREIRHEEKKRTDAKEGVLERVKDRGVLSREMHMGTKDTFCHHKHV